jgi:hypothetical protein
MGQTVPVELCQPGLNCAIATPKMLVLDAARNTVLERFRP